MTPLKYALVCLFAGSASGAQANAGVECGASWSPNGQHRASFIWRGGRSAIGLACSMRCEDVLRLPRTALAYRWAGPDRLEFASPRMRGERLLMQIGSLSVYAVAAEQAGSLQWRRVTVGRSACAPVEGLNLEKRG